MSCPLLGRVTLPCAGHYWVGISMAHLKMSSVLCSSTRFVFPLRSSSCKAPGSASGIRISVNSLQLKSTNCSIKKKHNDKENIFCSVMWSVTPALPPNIIWPHYWLCPINRSWKWVWPISRRMIYKQQMLKTCNSQDSNTERIGHTKNKRKPVYTNLPSYVTLSTVSMVNQKCTETDGKAEWEMTQCLISSERWQMQNAYSVPHSWADQAKCWALQFLS